MTTVTGIRRFLGVDDEFLQALTARADVATGRAVAGFATGVQGRRTGCNIGGAEFDACVRVGAEFLADARMAIDAGFVAGENRALDLERFFNRAGDCAAGGPKEKPDAQQQHQCGIRPAFRSDTHSFTPETPWGMPPTQRRIKL